MTLPVPSIDPPRRARAIAAHRPSGDPPVRIRAGQAVDVGRRDEEWPLWFRCRADGGGEGWIPEAWLERDGARATLRADYDATELEVAAGDRLLVTRAYGGWLWAETASGARGWVPTTCVEWE